MKSLFLIFATLLITSSIYAQADECAGATALPAVNGTCTTSAWTIPAAFTNSAIAYPACAGGNFRDGWMSFVATSTSTTINVTNSDRTMAFAVYSSCAAASLVGCADAIAGTGTESLTLTTAIGTTYYVRIIRTNNNNANSMSGNLCVFNAPAAPANNECTGAIALTVNPTTTCTATTAGTVLNATASAQANGCGGTADDDVWFSFVATSTVHSISLTGVSGSTTDMYHSVYAGTCGTPGAALVCSDPDNSSVSGLTIGNTYFVRVYTWTSTTGQTSTFNVCVTTPVVPPNDNCTGAIALTVNPNMLCGTQTAGTIAGATASTQTNGCGGTADDDVWYSFVATSTTHTISLNNVAGSTTDLYHSVYAGTCGTPGAALVCSDPNSSSVSGLTIGNTYFVRVFSWTSTTGQTSTFDICVGTPVVPPNDNCTGAVSLTVNPNMLCGTQTAGTIGGATASTQTNGCSGTADDDVWYSFVATSTTHTVSLNNITGSTSDMYMSVYSGTCGTPGAALICSDPESLSLSSLTIGNTYLVRVYSWTSTTGQTSSFNICVGTPVVPPNDNCTGAISVPVTSTSGSCTYTSGTVGGATTSTQTNDCFGTADDDVWYSFVATSSDVSINITNVTGSTTDLYHSVYAGSCGTPGTALVCSDPNTSTVGGLTVGNTYFIRIFSYTSTAGQTSVFDLCVSEIGACGATSMTEDFCSNPAVLSQGTGTWSSSTYPYYTADTPGNVGTLFCGSVENNSWYQFTAINTTETFNFSTVSGCVDAFGIQAEVFEVTTDVNGCCTGFTAKSNCFNPGVVSTGIVTATGLTVGQTYFLMVDGYAGDNCNFTVSNWTATGILLPVELYQFKGAALPRKNVLSWKTASEINNDHFNVYRSEDGVNFEVIGSVQGAGNSTTDINYQFTDENIKTGVIYYRLGQVDLDGKETLSDIVSLNRSTSSEGLLAIYPNPTETNLFVELNSSKSESGEVICLMDVKGNILEEHTINSDDFNKVTFDLSNLSSGIYILRYTNSLGQHYLEKIIKK